MLMGSIKNRSERKVPVRFFRNVESSIKNPFRKRGFFGNVDGFDKEPFWKKGSSTVL